MVNHFFAAWQRNGWEAGPLGYPTTDEVVNPDGLGRRQEFQNSAAIYWKLNEAYAIRGAIRDKWGQTGWEGGWLGYPVSDEVVLPDGQGRMNRFERGVIYWHPTFGAHPVGGLILNQWAAAGYEQGSLGYPIADEVASTDPAVTEQQFQNGRLYSQGLPLPVGASDPPPPPGVPDNPDVAVPSLPQQSTLWLSADRVPVAQNVNPYGCYGQTDYPHLSNSNVDASTHSRTTGCSVPMQWIYAENNMYRIHWYGAQYLNTGSSGRSNNTTSYDAVARWRCLGVGTYTYYTQATHEASDGAVDWHSTSGASDRFNC